MVGAYYEESDGSSETDNSAYAAGAAYVYVSPAPEIDVQRPAGTSIADGDTDNVGSQPVGTVNLF